jgi:hypothetical protein
MGYLKTISRSVISALFVLALVGAGTAAASQPKVELEAGQVFPVAITGHGGTGELTTAPDASGKVRFVHCTSSTSTGSINSATTVTGVTAHFKECTASGPFGVKLTCTTPGRGAGEITTTTLKGTLVYTKTASTNAGVLLEPAFGTTVAHFICGGVQTLTITGRVIGELTPVNFPLSPSLTLQFTESNGVQSPNSYLAPTGCKHPTAVTLAAAGTALGFGGENFGPIHVGLLGDQILTLDKKVRIASPGCV